MNNKLSIGIGVVALILAISSFFVTKTIVREVTSLAGITNYDSLTLGENLIVGGTAAITGATTQTGTLTVDGGLLKSKTIATSSTATTQTLVQADLLNYNTVLFNPGTISIAMTLPATSTLTTLVPTAGDMAEQCWYNATSSTASVGQIVWAAGTGIDLMASSTPNSITQRPGQWGCFTFVRQTDTDISALYSDFQNAD